MIPDEAKPITAYMYDKPITVYDDNYMIYMPGIPGSLRLIMTTYHQQYGSCWVYDTGQRGTHIDKKRDHRERQLTPIFIPIKSKGSKR